MTAIINEAGLEERERQRSAEALVAAEFAQLRAELANLLAELDQRRRADFEAIVALTNRLLAELFDKIDSKFAALQARVDEVLPDARGASRFARERADDVSELPNPLPPRRTIN
jgi:hypothetical protein